MTKGIEIATATTRELKATHETTFVFKEVFTTMKIVMALLLAFLAGCTTMMDLKPSSDQLYVLVPQDYIRIQTRGIGVQWAEGLKAGEYTAIAEDKDGIFFRGKGTPVIVLMGQNAKNYEKEKQIPASLLHRTDVSPTVLNVGGIWLPKRGVKKEPKIFYEIKYAGTPSIAGLVGWSVEKMSAGSLAYIPFGSEKEFIASLVVMHK